MTRPQIEIWPITGTGYDPRTHLWFNCQGILKRICDDAQWETQPPPENQLGFQIPCMACQEVYVQDAVHGHGLLRISYAQPPTMVDDNYLLTGTKRVPTLDRGVHIRYDEGTPHNKDLGWCQMLEVGMMMFAKFCTSSISRQQRIVADQLQQEGDSRFVFARDYYGLLRNTILRTHVDNQNLDSFYRDGLPALLSNSRVRTKQSPRFQVLGEAYHQFWSDCDGKPSRGPRGVVKIAELGIIVNPEVTIRTGYGDDQVVKLWFNALPPSKQVREILSYLMNEAKAEYGWPTTWQMCIYDVERKRILPPLPTRDTFAVGLAGQAAAYLEMRRHFRGS